MPYVFFGPWYEHIKMYGPGKAFGYSFSNYPPLYSHILSVFTLLPVDKITYVDLVATSTVDEDVSAGLDEKRSIAEVVVDLKRKLRGW